MRFHILTDFRFFFIIIIIIKDRFIIFWSSLRFLSRLKNQTSPSPEHSGLRSVSLTMQATIRRSRSPTGLSSLFSTMVIGERSICTRTIQSNNFHRNRLIEIRIIIYYNRNPSNTCYNAYYE